MREIKFRFWDELAGEITLVKTMHFYEEDGSLMGVESVDDDVVYFEEEFKKRCSLMQYTGIKDENGVDVYEGDHITIFKDGYYGGFYAEEKYSGVVDLDDTGTAFILKNATYRRWNEDIPNKIGDMEISFSMPDSEDLEQIYLCAFDLEPSNIVINGNIYENPELLEEN